MLIKNIKVKNFRSIRSEHLDCDNLTALLGRNGSGKSSFLRALDVFYDIAASVSLEDFFNREENSSIEIRVTYGNLRHDEEKEFRPYLTDDKLIITKRISSENGRVIPRYYAAVLQIQEFADIRARSLKKDRRSAWNQLIDEPGRLVNLGRKAKSGDEADRFMNEYESQHPELMEPIEREQQFFGPKNIGGGKLDKFTKYVLVPAVREASDEVTGRKSAIYQILDTIVLRKIDARKDIQEFKFEFNDRAGRLYCSENLTELPELGDSISETLAKFAPGSHLKLAWDKFELPQVQPPAAKATLIEDNFEGEISRKGHGLQRALILTLLQHLAMIVPTETTTVKPSQAEVALSASEAYEPSPGPDLILAIEEPELYLHPSRCRYLRDLLVQLVEKPVADLGARNQIIYSTHSPYLVDLHRFDQIRVIRKNPSADCPVAHSAVTRFTFDQWSQELARLCNAAPADFTRESIRAHAMSVMNITINEGFFADAVVVVEGPSDVGILWKLQEIMKKDWSQLGIVLLPVGGKNNIDRPTVVFRGFSIPTYFIFDADSSYMGKGDKKKEDNARKANRRCLCLAGVQQEDFPDTQVHETWAVFGDNIEKELEGALGSQDFQDIRNQVASEFGYPEAAQAIANAEGAARFIELAYQKGYSVPILEKIVEIVTLLCR